MKVLVVHRQASVADHIKDQLPQCIVTCVTCGWVGLSEARTKRYDLVISSYDLPVVTGFEMVRSLRMFSLNMQVPVIMLSDTGQKALACMEVFRISHLPVVLEKAYIGLISDRFIEDLNLGEIQLETLTVQLPSPHVHPDQHIYEVASLMFKFGLSLVPVVDNEHIYLGSITLTDLSRHLVKLLSIPEPGGVIILNTAANNYSASQISQIAEGNDARILSLLVNKTDDSGNLEITVKVDRVDLSALIQTFTRYGYEISGIYMDDSMLNTMYEDRIELLLRFMNI